MRVFTLSCLRFVSVLTMSPLLFDPGGALAQFGGGLGGSFQIPESNESLPSHVPCVLYTRDGKTVLSATSDGELIRFDASNGKLLERLPLGSDKVHAISVDPAGKFAVYNSDGAALAVMDVQSGKRITEVKLAADSIAVAPNGTVAAVTTGQRLFIWEIPSLQTVATLPEEDSRITNMAWSGDSAQLGWTTEAGQIVVYERAAGRLRLRSDKEQPLYALAFHPRADRIAYGGEDLQIYERDLQSGEERIIGNDQPYSITCLGYSPDGSMLGVGDECCDIWVYVLAQGTLALHSKHHIECWLNSVAWSPDSERFSFGCRPNDHAGHPAVFGALTVAEASQAEPVKQKEAQLLRLMEQYLPEADPADRKKLEQYKELLGAIERAPVLNESSLGEAFGGGGLGAGLGGGGEPVEEGVVADGDFQEATSLVISGDASALDLARDSETFEKLPAALQQSAREYYEELNKEIERLQSNYCLNQWHVRRTKEKNQ